MLVTCIVGSHAQKSIVQQDYENGARQAQVGQQRYPHVNQCAIRLSVLTLREGGFRPFGRCPIAVRAKNRTHRKSLPCMPPPQAALCKNLRRPIVRTPVGLVVAVLMTLGAVQSFSPRETPPLAATRLAVDRMHLNTLVTSKAALVTGGELGALLYSTNQGKHWERALVSTDRQALINQISFTADGLQGMAVGHEGWILHTTDGGLSWKEVAFDEKNGEPLMGVAQLPSGDWVVVGAFGRALHSSDQGKTWQPLPLPASVEDKHMNHIVGDASGQHWLIVGERGLVLRSSDSGQTWAETEPFYDGSLYNAVSFADGGWLVYGMRGNVFHTSGIDAPWVRSDMPVKASFYGHATMPDGSLVLVGQGSLVATSKDQGKSFSIRRVEGRASLTDLVLAPNGTSWLASDSGLQAFSTAPAADSTTSSTGAAQ